MRFGREVKNRLRMRRHRICVNVSMRGCDKDDK
jgi:hypothetical protein